MPMYKGKCSGEVLLKHITHISRSEVHLPPKSVKWPPKVGQFRVGVGYLFNQQVTWLAPFIYRGLKGVGLGGYMFFWVNKNQGLHQRILWPKGTKRPKVERKNWRIEVIDLGQRIEELNNWNWNACFLTAQTKKCLVSLVRGPWTVCSKAWNKLFQGLEYTQRRHFFEWKEALE